MDAPHRFISTACEGQILSANVVGALLVLTHHRERSFPAGSKINVTKPVGFV